MVNLTFGEQVKIILNRKGMTIKELAERIEAHTGKPMSRQNLTQRLSRDNFQEKDMRLIAEILGCKFELSILEDAEEILLPNQPITIGDLLNLSANIEQHNERIYQEQEKTEREKVEQEAVEAEKETEQTSEKAAGQEIETKEQQEESAERKMLRKGVRAYYKKGTRAENFEEDLKKVNREEAGEINDSREETEPSLQGEKLLGELNPYTRKEYRNNSVRIHPKRIGYVQVYDAQQHKWTEMTEWAFLGYQERKKKLLGKDYEPPIYLD